MSEDKTLAVLNEMEHAAAGCSPIARREMTQMAQTLAIARGLKAIRDLVTPEVLSLVGTLQNTEDGFLTDKDRGYDDSTLKLVVASALVRGARLTGNEFNIIAGKCYLTKQYWARMVHEVSGGIWPLFEPIGLPEAGSAGANLVNCRVRLGEQKFEFRGENAIAVRVNAGMIVDAVFGKAAAKAYRRVYNELVAGDGIPEEEETAG